MTGFGIGIRYKCAVCGTTVDAKRVAPEVGEVYHTHDPYQTPEQVKYTLFAIEVQPCAVCIDNETKDARALSELVRKITEGAGEKPCPASNS